jgi:hypothetical protein
MIEDALLGSSAADHVLIESAHGGGPRVVPEAVAPAPRLRSPIFEHRAIELLTLDDDRPSLVLPPLRAFIAPSGLALLIAAPILLVAGWQWALVAGLGAAACRELNRRVGRARFSLGDGFLPYRPDTGWPQGVQEDNDVHWNWSPIRTGGAEGEDGRGLSQPQRAH